MSLSGYYSQIHFQLNELEIFYNLPVVDDNVKPCHHLPGVMCSKAKDYAPEYCISERKCELYHNKDELFHPHGLVGNVLTRIDNELRKK